MSDLPEYPKPLNAAAWGGTMSDPSYDVHLSGQIHAAIAAEGKNARS